MIEKWSVIETQDPGLQWEGGKVSGVAVVVDVSPPRIFAVRKAKISFT